METSAKTGMNAQELYTEAAKLLFKDYSNLKIVKDYNLYKVKKKKSGEILKVYNNNQKNKGCCLKN